MYVQAISDPETHYRDTHVMPGDPLTLHARQSGTMRSLAIIIDTRFEHRRHRRHHRRRRRPLASKSSMSSPIINVISYGLLLTL